MGCRQVPKSGALCILQCPIASSRLGQDPLPRQVHLYLPTISQTCGMVMAISAEDLTWLPASIFAQPLVS